ncbi:hypothetical protein KBK19_09460 [Microvirga sp. STR05]|uniref:Uncharacterized protein n=1 Tax=Hymenobacter duratus TaxID=2771356 RepID=A0ABR8JI29_9BACT|nr:hypothetical protein [Hymenobacter duratus]MBD2715261.1 hypothetical protein [Hymenobacter duratus]MBR7950168.1 hypothetical protein [Microvirga sp. STR05]
MTYRPLFLLDADTASIFEIKRLDVRSDNPGDVYFWLYFDRASRQLRHLTFVSMNAEGDEQQREFTQGQLRFTASEGTYTPTDPGPALALQPVVPPTLPVELEAALFALFRETQPAE